MPDTDDLDPTSPAFKHALLKQARQEFRAFYSTATPLDAEYLDAVVMLRQALQIGVSAPRPPLGSPIREGLERTCDITERAFMDAKAALMQCCTFRWLPRADQMRIAGILFTLGETSEADV